MLRRPLLLRSSKLAQKRRKELGFKFGATLFLIVLLSGALIYLLGRPEVTIQMVTVVGADVIPESEIQSVAEQKLTGRYFFIFPRSSIFLFPRGSIAASVSESFKRIHDVDVLTEGFQEISVHVVEREPFALWCRKLSLVETCYFLDKNGYVFSEAPNFKGTLYTRYYGGLENVASPIGIQLLTPEIFTQHSLFVDALEQLGMHVESASLMQSGDRVFRLKSGSEILFSKDQELAVVLANLESALSSDVFKEKRVEDLEYLDLRFGNRVFYKMKNQEPVEAGP
jgi:hypothetical protein